MMPANDNGPLGNIYTLDEAAAYLRVTKHAVARLARRTGHCSIIGRVLRFSDSDLLAMWDEIRCRSANSNEETNGISGAPLLSVTEVSLSTRAQELLTRSKPKSSASGRKRA